VVRSAEAAVKGVALVNRQPVPIADITAQLHALGVARGGVLLVHSAFSKIAPIVGGPSGLIQALRDAVGDAGTLVMPSMSEDDEHAFDRQHTPCAAMGVVADTFWRIPDVLRSDSPHAFAAIGPAAAVITSDHPYDTPHSLNSSVGRVYELGGQILLLGVRHDANTTTNGWTLSVVSVVGGSVMATRA
jgi:aminoglycoside 3-N-acetyltransferase